MPFPKVSHCPKGHALHRAVYGKSIFFTSCAGPWGSSVAYHKWSKEGAAYMTCACGYNVCIACAEVGEYERGGPAGEGDGTLRTLAAEIVKDSAAAPLQEAALAQLGAAAAAAVSSAAYNFYQLAHHGEKNCALWRACCDWRALHAQLAALDDAGLRALCVAAASRGDAGQQLAMLVRGSLVELQGRLAAPPLEAFAERLASVAAMLHAANNGKRSEAFAGLVTGALTAVACAIA